MYSFAYLAGAAALAFQLAQAGPIARRDGISFITSDVYKNTYGEGPMCDNGCGDGETLMIGRPSDHSFDACYCTGGDTFLQADVDVANCLTNLHYTQKDVCISQAGSTCANTGSRIQNMRISKSGSTSKQNFQLTGAQSSTMQQGWNAFLNQKTDNSKNYPTVAMKDDNGKTIETILYYIGQDAC